MCPLGHREQAGGAGTRRTVDEHFYFLKNKKDNGVEMPTNLRSNAADQKSSGLFFKGFIYATAPSYSSLFLNCVFCSFQLL